MSWTLDSCAGSFLGRQDTRALTGLQGPRKGRMAAPALPTQEQTSCHREKMEEKTQRGNVTCPSSLSEPGPLGRDAGR